MTAASDVTVASMLPSYYRTSPIPLFTRAASDTAASNGTVTNNAFGRPGIHADSSLNISTVDWNRTTAVHSLLGRKCWLSGACHQKVPDRYCYCWSSSVKMDGKSQRILDGFKDGSCLRIDE